jgi:phage gpG-like protein
VNVLKVETLSAIRSFQVNQAQLKVLMESDVARDLARRAVRVESAAKKFASGRPGPKVRTGRLRGSITWSPGADERGPYVDVGSNVLYAPYVELGTSRAPAYPFLRPALEAARL